MLFHEQIKCFNIQYNGNLLMADRTKKHTSTQTTDDMLQRLSETNPITSNSVDLASTNK